MVYVRKLLKRTVAPFVFASLAASSLSAYTVVTVSTASPAGLEASFIAATTAQFTGLVLANPYASNTWTVKLYSPNPSYTPALTQQNLLNAMVAISTQDFVYGFADGMDYQNNQNIGIAGYFQNLCDAPTNYTLYSSTWPGTDFSSMTYVTTTTYANKNTFHANTCRDVLGTIMGRFFQLDLSTPVAIPPNGN
jgi:hypothetical protein